jgi:hypothetical protein
MQTPPSRNGPPTAHGTGSPPAPDQRHERQHRAADKHAGPGEQERRSVLQADLDRPPHRSPKEHEQRERQDRAAPILERVTPFHTVDGPDLRGYPQGYLGQGYLDLPPALSYSRCSSRSHASSICSRSWVGSTGRLSRVSMLPSRKPSVAPEGCHDARFAASSGDFPVSGGMARARALPWRSLPPSWPRR